uniref:Uncharacterized protein n=1 Tax=Tetranychus urticae TaxID=32264 RepID=T1K560_TETUR
MTVELNFKRSLITWIESKQYK